MKKIIQKSTAITAILAIGLSTSPAVFATENPDTFYSSFGTEILLSNPQSLLDSVKAEWKATQVLDKQVLEIQGCEVLFVKVDENGNSNTPTKGYPGKPNSPFFGKFSGWSKTITDTLDFTKATLPNWITLADMEGTAKQKERISYNPIKKDGEIVGYTIKTTKFGWFYAPVEGKNTVNICEKEKEPKTTPFYTSTDKEFGVVMIENNETKVNVEESKKLLEKALKTRTDISEENRKLAQEFLNYTNAEAEIIEDIEGNTLLFIKTNDHTTKVFHKKPLTALKDKFRNTLAKEVGKDGVVIPDDIDFANAKAPNWINDKESITHFNKTASGYTILTEAGHWYYAPSIPKNTVNFNADNGKAIPAVEVLSGSTITTVTNPTKDGYTFEYWEDTEDKTQITDLSTHKITKEKTSLVAIWKKIEDKKDEPKKDEPVRTGGGGGGGYTPTTTTTTDNKIPTKNTDTVVKGDEATREKTPIFPNFTKKCEQKVKDLTDSRLIAYYNDLNVINRDNLNRDITRAEFLKLLLNSANIDVSAESTPAFDDVPASHTLAKYISYATRTGLVSGQGTNFRPDDVISRAEAAKIFINATDLTLSTNVTTFSDVDSSHSLGQHIQTTYDNCLLNGRKTLGGETLLANGVRVYEPASAITLAETAKVLYNMKHQ